MTRTIFRIILCCLGLFGLMLAFVGNGGDGYDQYYALFWQEEVVTTDISRPLFIWTGIGMMFLAAAANLLCNLLSARLEKG